MHYDPEKHHRRSIRLKEYDYNLPGAYSLTIVAYNRECMFGDIFDDKMHLNELGVLVDGYWRRISNHTPNILLDEFIIMPNHIHGIIWIITNDCDVARAKHLKTNNCDVARAKHLKTNNCDVARAKHLKTNASPLQMGEGFRPQVEKARPRGTSPGSLCAIVQNFKSITTRRINKLRNTPGLQVWQRNYYEHIIRDEDDLNNIREYIQNNPLNWMDDEENPFGTFNR